MDWRRFRHSVGRAVHRSGATLAGAATALATTAKSSPKLHVVLRHVKGVLRRSPLRAPAVALSSKVGHRFRGHMRADELLVVLDVLSGAGIRCWVAGGWGVDALFGLQARRHDDVDVVLDDYHRDLDAAKQALATIGYEVKEEKIAGAWMPDLTLLDDGAGHRIEVLSIDRGLVATSMRSSSAPGGPVDPSEDLDRVIFSVGHLSGRDVPCLSLRAQLLFHTGFELRETDHGDIRRLQERARTLGFA